MAEVAAGVFTLAELLERTPEWTPPDLTGVELVAQPHCHHASVLGWRADAALLVATGATVTTVGGCCGLAGNFGVEKGHYDVSVKVAEHDLLPAVRARPTPSCWPTGSPAVRSWPSWPTAAPSPWPSCSRPPRASL